MCSTCGTRLTDTFIIQTNAKVYLEMNYILAIGMQLFFSDWMFYDLREKYQSFPSMHLGLLNQMIVDIKIHWWIV
jgi:hypothetical protein